MDQRIEISIAQTVRTHVAIPQEQKKHMNR